MPGSLFIKFAGITTGESLAKTNKGSEGWIEIGDWSFDIISESNAGKGQGSTVGKATTEGLTISHYIDVSSPTILDKMIMGEHFPLITIQMVKSTGGTDGTKPFFQVQVSEAYVNKVSTKGSGESGELTQEVVFTFKEIQVDYKMQKNDGKLAGTSSFKWSLKNNSETLASITATLA
jgi:type VI secretion system secreted protein Hcp